MRSFRWFTYSAIAMAAVSAISATSHAGCLDKFFEDVDKGYHRNKYWPEPFIMQDRAFVAAPFVVMTQKGWEEQNLLGENYFKKETGELNESGQLKVRWIMTQAPLGFRTVYIERANSPQGTADRMDATRRFADRIAIGGEVPDVRESNMMVNGWPAEYSDMIITKFQQSTPDPRLPPDPDAGATSGGTTQ
ncbi:MAG: hypothetical protein K8T91_01275 [Planctomycetes bacterium]|nr:hypothetical protein [Planctomycetota bacterium]